MFRVKLLKFSSEKLNNKRRNTSEFFGQFFNLRTNCSTKFQFLATRNFPTWLRKLLSRIFNLNFNSTPISKSSPNSIKYVVRNKNEKRGGRNHKSSEIRKNLYSSLFGRSLFYFLIKNTRYTETYCSSVYSITAVYNFILARVAKNKGKEKRNSTVIYTNDGRMFSSFR